MSDYTPTTEEVRARYNADEFGYSAGLNDPCPEFDRWLAEVKAQERERIIKLFKGQIRECECSSVGMRYCRHKTVFVPDLIALIEGEEQ